MREAIALEENLEPEQQEVVEDVDIEQETI